MQWASTRAKVYFVFVAPRVDLPVQLHFTEESLVLRTIQMSVGLFCRLNLNFHEGNISIVALY